MNNRFQIDDGGVGGANLADQPEEIGIIVVRPRHREDGVPRQKQREIALGEVGLFYLLADGLDTRFARGGRALGLHLMRLGEK